ncbi:MAG TPA: serine hydrolase domain-containing protein [Roseiflexaceae bacterium]|nr:serine hydrolase domain-containing protein [Roseiflexaceae bacterium]
MPLSHQIDSIVAGAIEQRIFPGAVVLIARGAEVLHYAAYGTTMYDDAGAVPVRPDTIYDIASLTKMFTATAALRLSDAGRLDLNAPVATYLSEFIAPEVTLQQLLTHTSGLDIRLSALRHAGRAALLQAIYHTTPAYPPGTRVAYTNVNSLLLGEIVSRLHGGPLDAALQDLVIGALGLPDTQFRPPSHLLPRIAPTERDEEWRGTLIHGSVHDESTHALGGVAGHAGMFSTAADIYMFCRAWLRQDDRRSTIDGGSDNDSDRPPSRVSRPLLKPETVVLATTNHTPSLNAACGLGWMLDRPNFMGEAPAGTYGHTGFTGPAMIVVPRHQLIVVLLSNRVYPRRRAFEHHPVTAAILRAAITSAA